MKMLCTLLAVCSIMATGLRADEAAATREQPDSSNWKSLFATDLSDAIYPKGVWRFGDGVLTATKDEILWTKAQYGDCIIDLDFKNAKGTTSRVCNSTVPPHQSHLKHSR